MKRFQRTFLQLITLGLPALALAQIRAPILDMHLHAISADSQGPPPIAICTPMSPFPVWDPSVPYAETWMELMKNPPCDDPIWSSESDEALMSGTIEMMERHNVFGVLSGSPTRVREWMTAAPDRFIPGLGFQLDRENISPDSLRVLFAGGYVDVLAEVTNQYRGIAPDDVRMNPYWSLAEEFDIPVGIHIGTGPPGVIYLGASGYRARLHSALTLEEVLVEHAGLRVYVMHAGYPLLDDMLALLYAHPQVYVDVGVIVATQPRAAFYRYLRSIVDAGFGNRVMFGSDQMVWPELIERSIRVIDEAPFLSELEKRDIFYNNAARFLRLSQEEINRHHNR